MSALAALFAGGGGGSLFVLVDVPDFPVWYVHGRYDGNILDLAWYPANRTDPRMPDPNEVEDITVDVSRSGGTTTSRQVLNRALALELTTEGRTERANRRSRRREAAS